MYGLDDKVAIVTGAARGIGAEVARTLAHAGAKLVLADVIDGKPLADELHAEGREAIFVHLDVRDGAAWSEAITQIDAQFGRLDILVNNAGVFISKSIEDSTEDDYQLQMDVNVKGMFLGVKHAIRLLRRIPQHGDSGSIINISSTAGLIGSSDLAIYGASKGAVRLFSKAAAVELPAKGIHVRCNSIHPGMIPTDMAKSIMSRNPGTLAEQAAAVAKFYPIGRIGQPADIASAVLYLASPASNFVTGTELVVDGGRTAH